MPTQVSIQGLRGSDDWGPDERPTDFREMILWDRPNGTAPLQALMALMGSESLSDPEYNWWTERQDPIRVRVNGAIADGVTTTITVDPGSNPDSTGAFSLQQGTVLMVNSSTGDPAGQEYLEVSSVTSDTEFEAIRGAAGTTAGPIPDDAYLSDIGTAFAEGTRSPEATFRNPTKFTNLAQLFKTTYDITETAKLTSARTGDPIKNDKRRKMFDHANKLEYAYIFGKQFETVGSNGKPKRYTSGILEYISTNRKTYASGGGDWNEDDFLDFITPVFDYEGGGAGDERIVFAGNGALNELNKLARDSPSSRINFDGVVTTYGLDLNKWVIPQGTLFIKTHPLFNVDPIHNYTMLGINQAGILERFLRSTKFKDNIQENDSDTQKGQWLTEAGIELHFEETFFALFNAGGILT